MAQECSLCHIGRYPLIKKILALCGELPVAKPPAVLGNFLAHRDKSFEKNGPSKARGRRSKVTWIFILSTVASSHCLLSSKLDVVVVVVVVEVGVLLCM